MLKIDLDGKYQLSSDSMNYILQVKGTVQTGKTKGDDTLVAVGYFSTVENALKAYKECLIKETDIKTINELLVAIKKIDKHIEKVLGGN